MAGSPLRFLGSEWPWRSLAYLLSGSMLGSACMVAVAALALFGIALALMVVGLALLAGLAVIGVPVATVERSRLRLIDPVPVTGAHRTPAGPGPLGWMRTRLSEPATWRELAYTLLLSAGLWPIDLLVAGGVLVLIGGLLFAAGAALINPETEATLLVFSATGPRATAVALLLASLVAVAGAYLVTFVAAGHAVIARTLLGSREEELGAQVAEVSRSRERLVNAFAAERRRIERDLHDGAQQRLVSLTMKLGIVRVELRDAGDDLAALLAGAHEDAKRALVELREIVNGVHPQLLTDRGLPPALTELARRSAVPAEVEVRLPGRLPDDVEHAAYFAVSEALTNVVKHSHAAHVRISGRLSDDVVLTLEVEDDGVGGAAVRAGGGLEGLADRLAVVNGTLTVSSPRGGPTVVGLAIPCAPGADGPYGMTTGAA
ncbi:sensor domain-containing protein [Actinomadura alba]|uniref:histidine kinase n=2 Tax=Actinomadura alba TaxID=406431 RepID=A0ABR7LUI4_9ACTN|nr:sensor domain-containing protein [Actinomadura alba]